MMESSNYKTLGLNTAQVAKEVYNPTLGENIDRRIVKLKAEIEMLEKAKVDMSALLNIRIGDMRRAMEY